MSSCPLHILELRCFLVYFRMSLYTLDINSLLRLVNVLFYYVDWPFTLLIIDVQKILVFLKSSGLCIFFSCLCFWCNMQEIIAKSNVVRIFACFPLFYSVSVMFVDPF